MPDDFGIYFAHSRLGKQFEIGNPAIISGMSGIDLVLKFTSYLMPGKKMPSPRFTEGRTPEYWAGWVLVYYQWYTAKRFKDIFLRVPLSEVLGMYSVFHEMDLSNFVQSMYKRCNEIKSETKLKQRREAYHLTQGELSKLSGVKNERFNYMSRELMI